MNDTGLCGASQEIYYEDILGENPLFDNFKGGLTENYVFNQLTINGLSLYYWTSGSQAEVDFITRIGNDIIPVEVKAKINNRSRSLGVYVIASTLYILFAYRKRILVLRIILNLFRFTRLSASSNICNNIFALVPKWSEGGLYL